MNTSDVSIGSKLLLGASAVLFIDLFLSWQKVCVNIGVINGACGSASGWRGIGVLVGLLALAVIAWEVVQLTGNAPELPIPAALVSAALGAALALFGLIEFVSHNEARHWPAWIGLICVIVVGVGAFRRFGEAGGSAAIARQAPPSATPDPPPAPPSSDA